MESSDRGIAGPVVTSRDVVQAIRRRWVLVLVCLVVGALAGGGAHALRTTTYSTTTSILVAGSLPPGTSALQASTLLQDRVKSLVPVAGSTPVTQAVVDELGLPYPARTLSSRIEVTVPAETAIMDIAVTDTDPARVVRVADAVVARFGDLISTVDDTGARVGVSVVQPPLAPAGPAGLGLPVSVLLGLLAGLVVAVVSAVVLSRRDDRMFTVREIDRSVSPLPVLPLRPRARREERAGYWQSADVGETFRRLYFLMVSRWETRDGGRVRRVLVCADVAGESRAWVSWQLARTMVAEGLQVVLLASDPADDHGAEEDPAAPTFSEVVAGRATVSAVVGASSLVDGVVVVRRGALTSASALGPRALPHALTRLGEMCDAVVVDAPALATSADAVQLARHVDEVLLVAQLGRSGRRSVATSVGLLDASGGPVGSVVAVPVGRRARERGNRGAVGGRSASNGPAEPRGRHPEWAAERG